MKSSTSHFTLGLIAAAVLTLSACGGGGDGGVAGTTPVTTTVMDGLIQNALVCVDANKNGVCDPTETQGRTDAKGRSHAGYSDSGSCHCPAGCQHRS